HGRRRPRTTCPVNLRQVCPRPTCTLSLHDALPISVAVFNDFVHPLYFLPGEENATVQLTLYNFMSQYSTQWNLLFMNILLITIPDRKSTRLNSSHVKISYAVFCLKKKKNYTLCTHK